MQIICLAGHLLQCVSRHSNTVAITNRHMLQLLWLLSITLNVFFGGYGIDRGVTVLELVILLAMLEVDVETTVFFDTKSVSCLMDLLL